MSGDQFEGKRQARYQFLIARYFTPLEARELSTLSRKTPALRMAISERIDRRQRFERDASRRIARGQWKHEDVPQKWVNNLTVMYNKRNWRVQEGPRGRQSAMPKGTPNPWAMYRAYVRIAPVKGYVSPWQLRQIRKGSTVLEQGLVFVQRAERQGGASLIQVAEWIREKNKAINRAKGQRKKQLVIERDRLARLLE